MKSCKREGSVLIFFLLLQFSPCFSQDSTKLQPPDVYTYLMPGRAVKVSILHPLFFYPTLQLAYEFKLSKRFTLQTDAGYVLNYHSENPEFQNKRGAKLKAELRYYIWPSFLLDRINYFSVEPYGHIVNFNRQETLNECFDLDCTIRYSRKYDYKVKYREAGLALKYGYFKHYNRFALDFNFGVALRGVNYIKSARPITDPLFPDIEDFGFNLPNENKRLAFSPVLDLRLVYLLR